MNNRQYKELMLPESPQGDEIRAETSEINSVPEKANRNRRNSRRKRVLMAGEIRFNENFATVKCVIRNISDTGALLKITDTNPVPHSFKLQIPMYGFEVECLIVDQSGHQVRVKFTSEKHQINSKKVQYIDATSNNSEERAKHHQQVSHASANIPVSHNTSAAKSTNNLISSFRHRKIETK